MGLEEKAEKLLEEMKKDRGYIYPEWEYAARNDPDFVEAYNTIYRLGLNDGQALSAREKEFVAIGILAFRGNVGTTVSHMQRAMRLGATKREILEVVETTLVPGGAPTFFTALSAMIKAMEGSEEQ
jgi:alkylhydroperoxidase/carboxymuconolactone decarboxylase family protein YurZ